ncbi:hypothetical protein ACIRPH_30870 [Nocardiopsis sp. NPDC101807]|uniref:hypothetical protein n=1 Tax=Nocardiopsis sp. NPDC101807 TaxID=3364339 RepID=UPI00382D2423
MMGSLLYCYKSGCGHDECRRHWNAYEMNRKRQIAYGRWEPYVDAAPAREHVLWLIAEGVPIKNLVPIYPTVHVLVYGRPAEGQSPTKRMRRESADALLAVRPTLDMLGERARIDGAGARRRVWAMCALGYSLAEQARRMGSTVFRFRQLLADDTVTVGFYRRVVALYDDVSMVRPEGWVADKTRRWAAAQGHLPPLAWDDDLIDLPEADLQVELSRRVAAMDDDELRRCASAYKAEGDRTPLISAAARVWRRRLESDRAA